MGTTTVAFIGLGNMGGPMALNLIKEGFSVVCFDLQTSLTQPLVDAGATAATTAIEAVNGANFVISMLPSGAIVESLYIHDTKLLDHIAQDCLVIDCSTVAPENSRALASAATAKNIRAIDAPVSGGVAAAAAGTLAFMCGGTEDAVADAKIVLGVMGANVFRAGDAGAGQVAKVCNNMLLAIHMTGTAEALQLGADNGLDPAVLSNIMLKSSGANWSLEKYNPYPGVIETTPASNDYKPGFMVKLMQKDLGLAMAAAAASDSKTPMGEMANTLYSEYSNDETCNLDFSSILKYYQQS
jgi:3-hydroxyisobutyrate dehydrogenase